MDTCQMLAGQLATLQAKLKNDQKSLQDITEQILLAQATLALDDPGFPAWTVLGVTSRIAALMALPMTPDNQALIGQYNVLLLMYATQSSWNMSIASDQGAIAGVQQQQRNAGCPQ